MTKNIFQDIMAIDSDSYASLRSTVYVPIGYHGHVFVYKVSVSSPILFFTTPFVFSNIPKSLD